MNTQTAAMPPACQQPDLTPRGGAGMGWLGLGWAGLRSDELGWDGPACALMNWKGLGRTGRTRDLYNPHTAPAIAAAAVIHRAEGLTSAPRHEERIRAFGLHGCHERRCNPLSTYRAQHSCGGCGISQSMGLLRLSPGHSVRSLCGACDVQVAPLHCQTVCPLPLHPWSNSTQQPW